MDYSAYLNLDNLSDESRKELENFIAFLRFKHRQSGNKEKPTTTSRHFNTLSLDTKGYKFNRDEANAR